MAKIHFSLLPPQYSCCEAQVKPGRGGFKVSFCLGGGDVAAAAAAFALPEAEVRDIATD